MKTSWLAAAGVTLLLVLWMASGLLGDDESGSEGTLSGSSAETTDATQGSEARTMRVDVMVAEPVQEQRSLVLRGEITAARIVSLRAETAGRVTELPVERGTRVVAGSSLAQLDPGVRSALLESARAQLSSARAEQRAAESLGSRGMQSQLQTEQAAAAAKLASSEVDRLELDLANTQILAPFDGVVEQLPLEIGQLVERGDTVATLVDDSSFKVTARAAQKVAAELKAGQPVTVTLITGQELQAELSWVSSVADAATRSFEVEAVIDNPGVLLSTGVSATLGVPVERVEAIFLSPSTFTLSEDGDLGVKIVDENERVAFLPVTVLRTSLDGAWVSGIEAGARIITLGQGFVSPGEQVIVSDTAPVMSAAQ